MKNLQSFDSFFASKLLENLSGGDEDIKEKIISSPEWSDFKTNLEEIKTMKDASIDSSSSFGKRLTNSFFGVCCLATRVAKTVKNVLAALRDEAKNSEKEFVEYLNTMAAPAEHFFTALCEDILNEGKGRGLAMSFFHDHGSSEPVKKWVSINMPDAYARIWGNMKTITDQEREEQRKKAEDKYGSGVDPSEFF